MRSIKLDLDYTNEHLLLILNLLVLIVDALNAIELHPCQVYVRMEALIKRFDTLKLDQLNDDTINSLQKDQYK